MTIETADGYPLAEGDRAFNYYDRKWGHIGPDIDSEGWFTFDHDDGTHAILNGDRIARYQPDWMKD